MPQSPVASTVRRAAVTVALLAFAALNIPLLEALAAAWDPLLPAPFDERRFPNDLLFLAEGLALCAIAPRASGLRLGLREHWRRFAVPLIVVFALPPVLTVTVYAQLTNRPFHGSTWSMWLVQAAAQELVFTGFLYAQLGKVYGEPSREWRGALHPVVLLSALCFAAWHLPNARWFSPRYLAFQLIYTFAGGVWVLQMRRWTGSLLPGMANHILVNWLATVV